MNDIIPVEFQNSKLFIIDNEGEPYVPMKPIVENMGLDWKTQYRKLQQNQRFAKGVVILTVPSPGGSQETTCLPLK